MERQLAAFEEKEKVILEKVDSVAAQIAQKYGYDSVPWFKLTWYLLWIYTVLTNLVLFHRSDFINLTVCVVAIYMMFNTSTITRTRFRMLVLGIFITLVWDLIWFSLKHSEYSDDLKHDGGNERGIRTFSLYMSYISFIVRVSLLRGVINHK
jgi:hypothetical protein